MSDMLATIGAKVDQITADDLIGRTITITVARVEVNPSSEQPVSIFYDGDNGRPYRPSKGMRRVLVKAWGPDASQYTGRSMTLYREDRVRFGALEVGGIRISHLSHLDGRLTMALTEKKGSKKAFTVEPLAISEPTADEAREWAKALVERVRAAESVTDLKRITSEPEVMDRRAVLMEQRPKLATKITEEVDAAMARLAPASDFPGDRPMEEA